MALVTHARERGAGGGAAGDHRVGPDALVRRLRVAP
jgi:hypothetical protein